MEKTKELSTKVITGKVRFSYLHVFEPTSINDQEDSQKKYSVSLVISKSDKATLKAINDAIAIAKEQGKSKKWGGKIPAKLKMPLRDGDEERPEDEVYKNAFFVNASSPTRPTLVDRDMNLITDPADLYSGCYGRASISFFAFNKKGNLGIACGLNHLQKMQDGEALGGRSAVDEDFEAIEGDDDDLM